MCRLPRRGRSPPLVASPLFFLPALFLLLPDRCVRRNNYTIPFGGGRRRRRKRKEKERERRQKRKEEGTDANKNKKVSPLLSFPFFSSFSPSSLAQRGRRDDKNKCKPGRRGKSGEGSLWGGEIGSWGRRGEKGGKAQKLGGGRGQKATKKVFLFFLLRHFRHSHFVIQSASGGRGKRERKKAFHSSPCQVLSPLSWISFFSLDENGANSLKTSLFPTILITCHYLPFLSCNFLNFRQANVIRNLN